LGWNGGKPWELGGTSVAAGLGRSPVQGISLSVGRGGVRLPASPVQHFGKGSRRTGAPVFCGCEPSLPIATAAKISGFVGRIAFLLRALPPAFERLPAFELVENRLAQPLVICLGL
jgi:hypothetical protein